MTRLERARALAAVSGRLATWDPSLHWVTGGIAASMLLDGSPARFVTRLPFVANLHPGNCFRDDGKYFRGPF